MCGIFGVFDRNGLNASPHDLLKGLAVASHRGPDGEGAVWFDTRCGKATVIRDPNPSAVVNSASLLLAHRRLAIIDLSDLGLQPMASNDEQLWITYNGEIYDYLELRAELESCGAVFRTHSDTEVILRAYEEWGSEAFTRFVGCGRLRSSTFVSVVWSCRAIVSGSSHCITLRSATASRSVRKSSNCSKSHGFRGR